VIYQLLQDQPKTYLSIYWSCDDDGNGCDDDGNGNPSSSQFTEYMLGGGVYTGIAAANIGFPILTSFLRTGIGMKSMESPNTPSRQFVILPARYFQIHTLYLQIDAIHMALFNADQF
jgi:hypothetical protein